MMTLKLTSALVENTQDYTKLCLNFITSMLELSTIIDKYKPYPYI